MTVKKCVNTPTDAKLAKLYQVIWRPSPWWINR